MKRFFYYFSWTVAVGFIIYLGTIYQFQLRQEAMATFNDIRFILYSTIFYISIGFLLKLPMFINEIKQKNQWTFDWIKFIAIGLPSFFIVLMYVLPLLPISESILPFIPQMIFLRNPTIEIIASVVFGYTFLDCLKK